MEKRGNFFFKRDLLVLGAFLLLGGGLFLLRLPDNGSPAERSVAVTVDGEDYAALPLDTDTTLLIGEADGDFNRLVIRGGEVWMESASCPDKLCVRHRRISRPGETIVCLPNRVAVTILGVEEAPDAVLEAGR